MGEKNDLCFVDSFEDLLKLGIHLGKKRQMYTCTIFCLILGGPMHQMKPQNFKLKVSSF